MKTSDYQALDESNPEKFTQVELDRMAMSYQKLIPVLIKATQEQQEQIELLKEEIRLLKEAKE